MYRFRHYTSVRPRQVAGATSRAGDAHSSGTPDLTLYIGSTLPTKINISQSLTYDYEHRLKGLGTVKCLSTQPLGC